MLFLAPAGVLGQDISNSKFFRRRLPWRSIVAPNFRQRREEAFAEGQT
jgi:hypothetical protein